MKSHFKSIALAVSLAIGIAIPLSAANAGVIQRFTATSTASGLLGYLEYDNSVFDGSSFQFVDNTNLLAINFVDPITLFAVTTPGPAGDSTIFDSTGLLPTVVGGSGFTGGTGFADGVWIAGSNEVIVANSDFTDVVWSTSVVSAVPEPLTLSLFGAGFAGAAALRRRKAKAA